MNSKLTQIKRLIEAVVAAFGAALGLYEDPRLVRVPVRVDDRELPRR